MLIVLSHETNELFYYAGNDEFSIHGFAASKIKPHDIKFNGEIPPQKFIIHDIWVAVSLSRVWYILAREDISTCVILRPINISLLEFHIKREDYEHIQLVLET